MIADILLVSLGVMGLVFASISDLKSKEIPDWLSFSLLTAALGIRLIYSIFSNDWYYFLYGVLGGAGMFTLGCILYYTSQWGGGDAKLVLAIGATFATRPYFVSGDFPFLVSMLVNILIVGSAYGLLWSVFLYLKHFRVATYEALRLMKQAGRKRIAYIVGGLFLAVSAFFIHYPDLRFMMFLLAGLLVAYSFLVYFVKAVEGVGMYKRLPVKNLVEGDWVAENVKVRGKVVCGPKDNGISKEQILILKRAKVRDVLVKEGIPFVPSFLIAVVLTLIFDNLVLAFI